MRLCRGGSGRSLDLASGLLGEAELLFEGLGHLGGRRAGQAEVDLHGVVDEHCRAVRVPIMMIRATSPFHTPEKHDTLSPFFKKTDCKSWFADSFGAFWMVKHSYDSLSAPQQFYPGVFLWRIRAERILGKQVDWSHTPMTQAPPTVQP